MDRRTFLGQTAALAATPSLVKLEAVTAVPKLKGWGIPIALEAEMLEFVKGKLLKWCEAWECEMSDLLDDEEGLFFIEQAHHFFGISMSCGCACCTPPAEEANIPRQDLLPEDSLFLDYLKLSKKYQSLDWYEADEEKKLIEVDGDFSDALREALRKEFGLHDSK